MGEVLVSARRKDELPASVLSGLLLFASEEPIGVWQFQLIAFIPLLAALRARRSHGGKLWILGVAFILGYVGPLLFVAGGATPILVVAAVFVLQWIFLAVVMGRLLVLGPVLGPAATAAVVTGVEIALWYLIPIFGHGQCFARPLALAPWMVVFVAYTGMGGVVFALVFLQGLLLGVFQAETRWRCLGFLIIGVILLGGLNVLRWTRPLDESVRIALTGRGFNEENLVDATQSGAALMVTSEAGTRVEKRESGIELFSQQAQEHNMALAVGVWNVSEGDNRAWLFNPSGQLLGEYGKFHLIPWLENYPAGSGELSVVDLVGCQVGTMICQDDNFTDLSRGYSRRGVNLVVAPSNDWTSIEDLHFENSLWRSLESGYAIARATSNGISALISPRGEIVARMGWPDGASQVLVSDVAVGDGKPTLYARLGDWPMLLFCLGLLMYVRKEASLEKTRKVQSSESLT